MEQSKINFEECLKVGEQGEKDVAIHLLELGYNVLPLYQFEPTFAPRIFNIHKNLTAPDLIVFNNAKTTFVEVKSKNRWIKYAGIIETGCDYRLYKEYKELSLMTKMPLHIIFNHSIDDPCGYFYIDINEQGRYWDGCNENGEKKSKAMYFWQCHQLKKL